MDLATVIGLVGALGLILAAMAMGVGVGAYIDGQSVLIVVIGSVMTLFISYKMEHMKAFAKIFMLAIKPSYTPSFEELIKKLVDYATQARRDGILSLEAAASAEEDEFLKKGLSMAVDGNEPDTIRELLEIEVENMDARHKQHASIFGSWSGLAGAMGMIGTLVGLVAMLLNMSDPSAIGPAMAVALLTTLYGAMIGNIFGGPISAKLLLRNTDEVLAKTMIIEGIMSIQSGDNPRTLEAKLLSFLAPANRQSQFES
jgi:chemotaxis protein MotA